MVRMKLKTTVPDKPAIVMIQEQIETYDELPFAGGLMAQPHILMMELEIAVQIRTIFSKSLASSGAK